MLFRQKPDSLLDSPNKLALLRHFFSEQCVPMSERELARLLGISNFSVNIILKEFEKANLLEKQMVGKSAVWQLRRGSYAAALLSPILAQLASFPPPLEHLKSLIVRAYAGSRLAKVILYGSVAEGSEGYGSDIDLLIVHEAGARRDDIERANQSFRASCLSLYGNNVQFIVLDEKGFKAASGAAWMESVKRGIVVFQRSG